MYFLVVSFGWAELCELSAKIVDSLEKCPKIFLHDLEELFAGLDAAFEMALV